jgi:uncharacterized membrane protein YbhN (UPF0104 family)
VVGGDGARPRAFVGTQLAVARCDRRCHARCLADRPACPPRSAARGAQELAASRGHLRDVAPWIYVATVPLTLVNIAARVAILPLLAQTLDQPQTLAATVVGSFALVYAQAMIPTPAGAGAVELGFLGGAAGNLGAGEAELLVSWRMYTTVLGTISGAVLGACRFRADVITFVLRRPGRSTASDGEA